MGSPNCAESDDVICIDDDDDDDDGDDDDVHGGDDGGGDGGGDGAASNEEMDWSQKERQRKGKMPFVSAPAAVPGSIAGANSPGTSKFAADETIVIEEELGEDDDLVVTGCTTTSAPALNGGAQLQGYRFGAASVASDACPVSDGGSDDDDLFVIHPGTSKEDAKQKRARTMERTHVADARAAKRSNRNETGTDATVCVKQATDRSDVHGHRAPPSRAPAPTRAQCAAAVGGGPGEVRSMPSSTKTTKVNTAAAAAAAAPKRAGPTPAAAAKAREKALRRDEREEEMRAKGKKCEKEVTLVMESSALEQTKGVGHAIVARMKQMGMLYRVEASNAGDRDHGAPLDSDWILLRWVWHRPVDQSEPCTAGDAPSAPRGSAEGEVSVPYVMLIIGADSIANMVKGAGGRQAFAPTARADGLERIVHAARARFRGSTICILMVGMDTGSVRSRERKEFSQQATARKPTDQGRVAFTMGAFRQQITSLCVRHDFVRYHIVGEKTSAADYVYHVSLNLGKVPYKLIETDLTIAGAKKVAASVKAQPVWVRMLCSIPKVSEKQAMAVAGRYRNIFELTDALLQHGGAQRVSDLLMDNGKRVGPACATRLHDIFTADRGDARPS